ncbi:MAG: NUDIX domain-containing protein [Clostridia bacterium]|nr:NUDIX domain-containing protein [Clostridia bacterium]
MEYYKQMRQLVGHRPLMLVGAGVILYRGRQLLLQKRTDDGTFGKHGGIMDYEEVAEDACRREVMEEIGLRVGKLTLFGVYTGPDMTVAYPNGDIANYTDIVYVSDDFDGEPSLIDGEAAELGWFDIDALPNNLHSTDRRPILEFAEQLRKRYAE